MRGVVARDVPDAVAAGGGTLDELFAVLAAPVDPAERHVAVDALVS